MSLHTLADVARHCQTAEEVIRAHLEAGRLKGMDLGVDTEDWRFTDEDVAAFLATLRNGRGTRSSATPPLTNAPPDARVPSVFRINLKPGGGDPTESRAFCLRQGLAGMGWGVAVQPGTPLSWDQYRQSATTTYPKGEWVQPVTTLHDLPDGSLIWTRTGNGPETEFWLGLVVGPWQYRTDQEAIDVDIVNVRPVIWYRVGGYAEVPDAIAKSFTPPTIAPMKQAEALAFSHGLAARLAEQGVWPLPAGDGGIGRHRPGLAEALDAIALSCARRPVLDARSADEILGYDDQGVPRP